MVWINFDAELIPPETEGPFLSLASGYTVVHHLNGPDYRSQCNELFHERQPQPVYVYSESDDGQNNTDLVALPLVYKYYEICHLWHQRHPWRVPTTLPRSLGHTSHRGRY